MKKPTVVDAKTKAVHDAAFMELDVTKRRLLLLLQAKPKRTPRQVAAAMRIDMSRLNELIKDIRADLPQKIAKVLKEVKGDNVTGEITPYKVRIWLLRDGCVKRFQDSQILDVMDAVLYWAGQTRTFDQAVIRREILQALKSSAKGRSGR